MQWSSYAIRMGNPREDFDIIVTAKDNDGTTKSLTLETKLLPLSKTDSKVFKDAFVIYVSDLQNWQAPANTPLTVDDMKQLMIVLDDFLNTNKIKYSFK
jgi:hypothetical protein